MQPSVKGKMAVSMKAADSRRPGMDDVTKETNEKAASRSYRER